MDNKIHHSKKQWSSSLLLYLLCGAAILIYTTYQTIPSRGGGGSCNVNTRSTAIQMDAIVHYATSRMVPQQTLGEITVSLDVLKRIEPCNFLVFGLGNDSFMWAALNPSGTTLFLEEDPTWVTQVLNDVPVLRAGTVSYRTKLSEADLLLRHYEAEPRCWPANSFLRGNTACRLALNMLSNQAYDTEWDMIMIDAPRAYSPDTPGRMAAIYSAAVMAKNRRKSGLTHVFLHDVDRTVEKTYAEKFLCRKYLVEEVGKLWHFEIPSRADSIAEFC